MKLTAIEAARLGAEIAGREIQRLAKLPKLTGFDAMDLAGFVRVCLTYDNHRKGWLSKLNPKELTDELLDELLDEGADGSSGRSEPRRAAG